MYHGIVQHYRPKTFRTILTCDQAIKNFVDSLQQSTRRKSAPHTSKNCQLHKKYTEPNSLDKLIRAVEHEMWLVILPKWVVNGNDLLHVVAQLSSLPDFIT